MMAAAIRRHSLLARELFAPFARQRVEPRPAARCASAPRVWCAWLLTLYLMLDASIHWVGPQGVIGSLPRGVINSIPPLLFLILGLLRRRRWAA